MQVDPDTAEANCEVRRNAVRQFGCKALACHPANEMPRADGVQDFDGWDI